MEKRISLLKGFFVALLAVVINLCYHLGVVSTLKFCVVCAAYLLYSIGFLATAGMLVASIFAAVTSFVAEVVYGVENGVRVSPLGNLLKESATTSVFCGLGGLFAGELLALVFVDLSNFFAPDVNVWFFPSAELFRFENLFPVFWEPYLVAYVVSSLLALLVWCDRKHCALKRKKGKKTKTVIRW